MIHRLLNNLFNIVLLIGIIVVGTITSGGRDHTPSENW